jgi:hypothetical protein
MCLCQSFKRESPFSFSTLTFPFRCFKRKLKLLIDSLRAQLKEGTQRNAEQGG